MAHYRMTDKLPSAIITVDGNEKKIYEGNQVFLQNGENFEIRFFNPLQEKIGVEILFNGQKKNDGLLVLRPGEDITLDRFLGEKKKMKFDIYTIDGGNSAAVKAAEINGLIEFKFYKEKNVWNNNWNNICYSSTSNWTPSGIYCRDIDSAGTTLTNSIGMSFSETTTVDYSIDEPKTRSVKSEGILNKQSATEKWAPITEKVETGRIEKGPESAQEIKTVDAEFETTEFHTITYQMKPNSAKPTTNITEIRNYCTECGYRIRKSHWKFCPKCGENL